MAIVVHYSDELSHHGILGQRWGVRRYQNKDGTRTPAGKKRYDGDEHEEQMARTKITNEEIVKSGNAKLVYKNRANLSNQEMANAIQRINFEKTLKKTISEENEKKSSLYKFTQNAKKVTDVLNTNKDLLKAANDAYEQYGKAREIADPLIKSYLEKRATKKASKKNN